jgi:hypothetical protein
MIDSASCCVLCVPRLSGFTALFSTIDGPNMGSRGAGRDDTEVRSRESQYLPNSSRALNRDQSTLDMYKSMPEQLAD